MQVIAAYCVVTHYTRRGWNTLRNLLQDYLSSAAILILYNLLRIASGVIACRYTPIVVK